MRRRNVIGSATAPDGTLLELVEHHGDFQLDSDGMPLMTTRMVFSEQELARFACEGQGSGARVLIGGMGFGYTLRTALDHLPEDAAAVVCELVPEVVEWNRGPVAHKAGHPLDDPRADVVISDIHRVLRRQRGWNAIMLDVDNGPPPKHERDRPWLYTDDGLRVIRRALVRGGRLAIWSAEEAPGFPTQLAKAGFEISTHRVRAREGKGGRHVIFVGVAI